MNTRSVLGICDRVVLDGARTVTVMPTSPKVPEHEVNVMDPTGTVQTVRVNRLIPESWAARAGSFSCSQCEHVASRSGAPWDNQYRCGKGCRCTMQGCCPGPTRKGPV